jgi:FlaA1/EpsC-like NDP-sugar epimerase
MLERASGVAFIPRIGDIRESDSVEDAIRAYGIDCIFHAAAYKHVPMMEEHLVEAVQNNVFGTKTLVEAAIQNRVRNFVMISSDKAVRPTNIMGATKRIAELIVSGLNDQSSLPTKFVSVRFGNVLGSNGSVVPLFREQIAKGGPVTVTHPEIQRYFMTIPEAVELVLQASTMGKGSEIFVLDMGEPVKIVDLARNMIRLSGKEPDSEIEIRFTGLRPGEKLSEEISLEGEDMMPTFHPKIRIFKDRAIESREVRYELARLLRAAENRDLTGVIEEITRLVPEYTPSAAWRERLEQARGAAEPQSKKRVHAVGAGA